MWNKLRKFGLDHHDLQTMIWNIAYTWRHLTINIDSRNKEKIPFMSYVVTAVAIITHFYVYILSVISFVVSNISKPDKTTCAVIAFSLGVCSNIGLEKLYCMLFLKGRIRKLVDGYLACDALVEPGSRLSKNLLKTLRVVKRRALIYWSIIVGNGILYIIKALVTPGRHIMEDCFYFYGFEEIMYVSPYYEIAFILNIGAIYAVCYLPANITAFFIVVIGYTEAQILALSEELLNIWDDAMSHYGLIQESKRTRNLDETVLQSDPLNEYVRKRLKDIIVIHKKNIELINKVQKTINVATLIQFLIVMIAIITILLGGLEKTYIQLPFPMIMVTMDCLVGQRLINAGEAFENAVYACKWENFDVTNKKTVLFMLLTAQRGIKLSAGSVVNLNYECIKAVENIIYSSYTTLKSSTKM